MIEVNEHDINRRFAILEKQRNDSQNQCVYLEGAIAVLTAEIAALKELIPAVCGPDEYPPEFASATDVQYLPINERNHMSYFPTPGDTLFYYTPTDHVNPFGFAVSKVESDGTVSGMQLRYYGTPTSTAWQQIHNLPLVQFGDTPPVGAAFVTPRSA